MLRRSAPNFVLPVLVAIGIASAFLAGHYIGEYDALKQSAAQLSVAQAINDSDDLVVFALVAEELERSNIGGAQRVLETKARAAVAGSKRCMKEPVCSRLAAPNDEKASRLRFLVAKYGPSAESR